MNDILSAVFAWTQAAPHWQGRAMRGALAGLAVLLLGLGAGAAVVLLVVAAVRLLVAVAGWLLVAAVLCMAGAGFATLLCSVNKGEDDA